MMVTQGAKAPEQTQTIQVLTGDPFSDQLEKLVESQVQSSTNLARLEGERASLALKVAKTGGEERQTAVRQLAQTEQQIAGERAKLAQLKSNVDEIRSQLAAQNVPAVPVPPEFAGFPNEKRIFGMNQNEASFTIAMVILVPFVLLLSRYAWSRTGRPVAAKQPVVGDDRMARIEQAVEAVAIEVERISESQRYQTKLMAEKTADRAAVEPR